MSTQLETWLSMGQNIMLLRFYGVWGAAVVHLPYRLAGSGVPGGS